MHIDPKKNMQLILDTLDEVTNEVKEKERRKREAAQKKSAPKHNFDTKKIERICKELELNNQQMLRNHEVAVKQMQAFTDTLDRYATFLEKKAGIKK